jgi:hypothetical protein
MMASYGKYSEAERLLSAQVEAGDPIAKLLVADARVRNGETASAREVVLDINVEEIPARLRYVIAVACPVLALSSRDAKIRALAIRAVQTLPKSRQEDDQNVRELMRGLNDDDAFR